MISQLTPSDRRAMEYLATYIPRGDCIRISENRVGRWIPVLTGRCTDPMVGYLMFSQRNPSMANNTKWRYYGLSEKKPADGEYETVFNNGALVLRYP